MNLKTELLFDFNRLTDFEKKFFRSINCFDYIGKNGKLWHKEIIEGLLNAKQIHIDPSAKVSDQATLEGPIYISSGAIVEPGAYIKGPCYIGKNVEIRHSAYIRGNVFIASNAVVGHASEVKGSILLHGAKAAHFAYLGDAILGSGVNLGAGTKLANLKFTGTNVHYKDPVQDHLTDSGQKKFSAFIGDDAQTGCNAVLSPGTLLFPKTIVMSCKHFRGTLKAGIAR